MGRPQIRTEVLNLDARWAIKHAFGTARNAWNKLRLDEGGISFATLKRALSGYAIEPEDKARIEDHWDSWVRYFIRPELRGRFHDLSATVPFEAILPLKSAKSYTDQHSEAERAWFAAHPGATHLPDDDAEATRWYDAQPH